LSACRRQLRLKITKLCCHGTANFDLIAKRSAHLWLGGFMERLLINNATEPTCPTAIGRE
jgi:hypothetical protein